jgi:hypothetical protein
VSATRKVTGGLLFWRSTPEDRQQATEVSQRLQTAQSKGRTRHVRTFWPVPQEWKMIKKFLWYGLIVCFVLFLLVILICPYLEERLKLPRVRMERWDGAPEFQGSILDIMPPYPPKVILEVSKLNPVNKKASIKAQCTEFQSRITYKDASCKDVYVRQREHIDSNIILHTTQLDDQKEKNWQVIMEGDQFYFPFERYTIVVYVGKAPTFFVEGQIEGFKRNDAVSWDKQETINSVAELQAEVRIHFHRPWC